jgi:hypothetical protein
MAAVLLMRPLGIWGIWKKEKDVAAKRHLLLEKWTVAEESHSTSNLTQDRGNFIGGESEVPRMGWRGRGAVNSQTSRPLFLVPGWPWLDLGDP